MNLLSTNKLGAISLVVGPILAFVMFLIQPGGLLIHSTPGSDSIGLIGVWQANALLVKFTSGFIMLGLVLMAFGIYEVHVAHRGSRGDGLNMAGLATFSLGVIAWLMLHSLTITLAQHLSPERSLASSLYNSHVLAHVRRRGIQHGHIVVFHQRSLGLQGDGVHGSHVAGSSGWSRRLDWVDRSNPQLEFHGFDDHAGPQHVHYLRGMVGYFGGAIGERRRQQRGWQLLKHP